jgi:hypothetical protein
MSSDYEVADLSKTMSENGAYVVEIRLTGTTQEDYFIERM